jgi:HEAT repeat protein
VKYKEQKPFAVPDLTKASRDELIAKLGGDSLAQSHLAWQAIADRNADEFISPLEKVVADNDADPSRRVAALWAREGLGRIEGIELWRTLLTSSNRNVRREAVRALSTYITFEDYARVADKLPVESLFFGTVAKGDEDPEVRAEMIRAMGRRPPRYSRFHKIEVPASIRSACIERSFASIHAGWKANQGAGGIRARI